MSVPQTVAPDLTAWRTGPLPIVELEQAAAALFRDLYPVTDAASSRIELDIIRTHVVRQSESLRRLQQWTLGTMHVRLLDGFTRIVCWDRRPSPAEHALLRDYAEECLLGLMARFYGDRNPMIPSDASHTWTIPSGQGISEEWRQAYVATKFAEVLTALTVPGVPFLKLDVSDRAWLRGQTDQLVEDVIERFESYPGDPEYRPQDEADYGVEGRR